MSRPTPQHSAPILTFSLFEGGEWSLSQQNPEKFNLIIFYRGLHCPVCEKYLQKMNELLSDYEERGVEVVAVSMDSESRARLTKQKWEIDRLKLGYGLSEEMARSWGLYISNGISEKEPDLFSEPGLFLIDNSNDVYYCAINSNPWGRPHLPSFLKNIDYILENDYPARGENI